MRWGGGLSAAAQRRSERRRWPRLFLAIPAFVRGVNGQGREFLEFSTLLNESAGGVLLAIRKPLRRRARVSLDTFCTPFEGCEVAAGCTNAACARGSNHVWGGLEPVWITICPSPSVMPRSERTSTILFQEMELESCNK